jgi:hypothetical protein
VAVAVAVAQAVLHNEAGASLPWRCGGTGAGGGQLCLQQA